MVDVTQIWRRNLAFFWTKLAALLANTSPFSVYWIPLLFFFGEAEIMLWYDDVHEQGRRSVLLGCADKINRSGRWTRRSIDK